MTRLEQLLEDTISETPTSRTVNDWDSVLDTVERRERRRSNGFRLGVALLIALLGFGVFSSRFGTGVETIPAPSAGDPALPQVVDGQFWPSNQDLFDAAGERGSQFWVAWLVGAGLPLLAGVSAWLRAPSHLRTSAIGQGRARLVVALARAFQGCVVVGALLSFLLFFTYDPLAVRTGQSWLFAMFQVAVLMGAMTAVTWTIVFSVANDGELRGVKRIASSLFGAVASVLVVLFTLGIVSSIPGLYLDWEKTQGVDGPVRGLWRLLLQGDATFRGPSGVLSPGGTALTMFIMATAVAVFAWVARNSERQVLAGQPLQSWRSTTEGPLGGSFFFGTVVVLALALPTFVILQKDIQAQSIAHLVALPADVPVDEWSRTEISINRNPFDQLELATITFWPGTVDFPEITDEELLRAEFGFDHRGQETVVRNRGLQSPAIETWSVERNGPAGSIVVTVRREVALGLNTSLYLTSLLLLAATSARLRRRRPSSASGELLADTPALLDDGVDPEQTWGARSAAWFTMGSATVIGVRLVNSLYALERDAGTLADRNGASLYEVYTTGRRPIGGGPFVTPKSLDALSAWFLLWNVAILVPVFWLGYLGARRLYRGSYLRSGFIAAAAVATGLLSFRFWELVSDWANWFLD